LGIEAGSKRVTVTFRSYDVGDDDCDEAIIPPTDFGEFTINITIRRFPEGSELLRISRMAAIGYPLIGSPDPIYEFTAANRTVSFTLGMEESFEIRGTISEADEFPELETPPTAWSFSRIFQYADLPNGSETNLFGDGPGCFRDDTVEVLVVVVNEE